jgi:hypothetical protein
VEVWVLEFSRGFGISPVCEKSFVREISAVCVADEILLSDESDSRPDDKAEVADVDGREGEVNHAENEFSEGGVESSKRAGREMDKENCEEKG